MFVGLSEAELAELQLLLGAVNLPRKLMDGAAKGGGQVFAQRHHDAPQHVVMENPRTAETKGMDNFAFDQTTVKTRVGLDALADVCNY